MDDRDCKKTELIAEVTVQRFFQHYLEEVFPKQLEATITAHNKDITAHKEQIEKAVEVSTVKFKLWLFGIIFAGGVGSGVGAAKIVTAIMGGQ